MKSRLTRSSQWVHRTLGLTQWSLLESISVQWLDLLLGAILCIGLLACGIGANKAKWKSLKLPHPYSLLGQ